MISKVTVTDITETTATVNWITDDPATSQVEYGMTTDYGLTTVVDENLVTIHSISLSGLESNTAYHFKVRSKDNSGTDGLSVDYNIKTNNIYEAIIISDKGWRGTSEDYQVEALIQNTGEGSIDICVGIKVYDSNSNCVTPQNDWFETYKDVDVGEMLKVTGPFRTAPNGYRHSAWIEWIKPSQISEPITTSDVIVDKVYFKDAGTPHIIFKNMTNRTVSVHYEFKLYNQDNTVENAWERWINIGPSEGTDVSVSWLGYCENLINKVYILGVS